MNRTTHLRDTIHLPDARSDWEASLCNESAVAIKQHNIDC
jgi:hypothetical protein